MKEFASQILIDYLPVRMQSKIEDDYQWYLWNSFSVLSEDLSSNVTSFSIVPFHMLFMLAAQYKALRISKLIPLQYCHAFTFRNIHNHASLLVPTSPYDFSDMNERSLFDIFRLIGAEDSLILDAKKLVDGRNTLAHSCGVIGGNVEQDIQKYLNILNKLQKLFTPYNDLIADEWDLQIDVDDDKTDFVETRLAVTYLSHADFLEGRLVKYSLSN